MRGGQKKEERTMSRWKKKTKKKNGSWSNLESRREAVMPERIMQNAHEGAIWMWYKKDIQ